MDITTGPADDPTAPDSGDDLASIREDLAHAVAEIREEASWLLANLRELAGTFGLGPDRPAAG